MTAWVSLFPALLAGLGILAAIGLPSALALRARGFVLLLVGIPAALATLALTSLVLPRLGISFSLLPVLLAGVALGVLLLPLRRWASPVPGWRPTRASAWVPLASAALGGAIIASNLLRGIKRPEAISQSYDGIFHLNAVRFILDTGSASPLHMTLAVPPDTTIFYPTLWHSFVALLVQATGVSIPVATNAAVFLVCAVIWPIGAVALARAVLGPSSRVTVAAGILSAAFSAFPLLLVHYGVLYPNLLATALIPYALIALLAILRLGPAERVLGLSRVSLWILFLGAAGAGTLAHPNALFSLILIALPAVLSWAITRTRTQRTLGLPRARRWIPWGIVALVCLGVVGLWRTVGTSDNSWAGDRSFPSAIFDALGNAPRIEGHAWVLTVLIAIGAVLVFRGRSSRWLLVSYAVLLLAFGVANGFPASAWRTALLGAWYNDSYRLASLLPVVGVVLGTAALSGLALLIRIGFLRLQAATGGPAPRSARSQFVPALALVLLGIAATQGSGIHSAIRELSFHYDTVENAALLDSDERRLLDRLASVTPEDALIAGNPWNGSALAYAISDRRVVIPHTGGSYSLESQEVSRMIDTGSKNACLAADTLGVTHVLDFGSRILFEGDRRANLFTGTTEVGDSPVLTEVDREGDAVLYELTGCGYVTADQTP